MEQAYEACIACGDRLVGCGRDAGIWAAGIHRVGRVPCGVVGDTFGQEAYAEEGTDSCIAEYHSRTVADAQHWEGRAEGSIH